MAMGQLVIDGTLDLARRAARLWHMANNVPPRQLLRRAELRLRGRFAEQLYAAPLRRPMPVLATQLPQPLFPPRTEQAGTLADGFQLNLPWGQRIFALPVNWRPAVPDRREGSWRNRLHYMEFLEGFSAGAGA